MKLVLLETPYAGEVRANIRFAQSCMLDCFHRGEAPFASHLLYTQVLMDDDPVERKQGIEAGLLWGAKADYTVVYTNRGITTGMAQGIKRARQENRPVFYRALHWYS